MTKQNWINDGKKEHDKSTDGIPQTPQEKYKWWPINDKKKLEYQRLYPRIKPLFDKGKNYTQIAKELNIDRHKVSHVLIWFSKSPEAYGK